ncbi:glucuronosyltransferase [Caenorhabditis elegans]|uniref:glucuronosyltransferase n=1 Tax=Caenorhabditis elegans TaxID=6239 RepID=O16914_CAEEL|nr:glucuronosyltransferase [Caenorhabditis elegans]CCD69119.1 glucuronosyltransferase [Caenorhabditis elegans]|eukprot:NP_504810.2 UDP-GlucuronosylTransferase [Caenorhabditis elegans]
MKGFSLYLYYLLLISSTTSYNILVFCPLFGHSHSTFFGRLADILTEAGHNVTLFSPTIIDEFRNYSYTKLTKDVAYLDPSPELKAIGDLIAGNKRWWNQEFSVFEIPQTTRFFKSITREQNNVLANNLALLDGLKQKKFDLILFESVFTCALPLMEYLEIKSFAVAQSIAYEPITLGALGDTVMTSHIPNLMAQSSDKMSLCERMLNTLIQAMLNVYGMTPEYYQSYTNPEKKIYTLEKLSEASFIFMNSNPFLDFPRATITKNIQIGGISVNLDTLKSSGKLTEEWDQILNLREKTLLVSFGSVILSQDMPFAYKVGLTNAMKQLNDVTFIWKYEGDDKKEFANGIKNIHFSKWVPQRELLADPRLSAFMTHGGLGSVNEVSYFGKPTIMCPLSGDQMRNAKMLERHNGSIEFSKYDLHNEKVVANAFRKILYDESYTLSAKRLSEHLQFQPVKPKELFLKHVEFAARFGKLPSLDPYSRQMGFIQYFLIDIAFIVLTVVLTIVSVLYFVLKFVASCLKAKIKTD